MNDQQSDNEQLQKTVQPEQTKEQEQQQGKPLESHSELSRQADQAENNIKGEDEK